MNIIEVKQLSKTFYISKKRQGFWGSIKDLFNREYLKKEAVKDVSFSIKKGELVGYIGTNGAGKSTTIKMLCGILHPDNGVVKVNGVVPFDKRRENNMNIGVVFGQRGQLWRDLAVQDSFILLKKIYEVSDKDYEDRMKIFDEILNIKELLPLPVRKLSLGQRMRAEFVASLIHWPKILYLDEPTIGLDVITRKRILEFVKRLNKEYETTVILTTHNMQDIEEICDRIILIDNGQIIYDGGTQRLKQIYSERKRIIINYYSNIKYDERKLKELLKNSAYIVKKQDKQLTLMTKCSDVDCITKSVEAVKSLQPILNFEVLLPRLEDILENIMKEGNNNGVL